MCLDLMPSRAPPALAWRRSPYRLSENDVSSGWESDITDVAVRLDDLVGGVPIGRFDLDPSNAQLLA